MQEEGAEIIALQVIHAILDDNFWKKDLAII
jgi:hypothetical protein